MSDRRKAENALGDAVAYLMDAEKALRDALAYIEFEGYPGNAHLSMAVEERREGILDIARRLDGFEVRS